MNLEGLQATVSHYEALLPYQTLGEAAEACVILALLAPLALSDWRVPSALKREVKLPILARVALVVALIWSTAVFALSALMDISGYTPDPSFSYTGNAAFYKAVVGVANVMGLHSLVKDWTPGAVVPLYQHFGLTAFEGFAGAILCFCVLRMRRGIARGVRDGILFGAGTLVLFEVGLWASNFGSPFGSVMPEWAANFVEPLTFAEVPLVSNWIVLIASFSVLGLFVVSALLKRRAKPSPVSSKHTSLRGTEPSAL